MWAEFKEFINQGNVVGFAVAVIMAGAFGAVVTSFTGDILMPPIGMAMGGVDFTELGTTIQEAAGDDVKEVRIKWGLFLKYLIDFLIISFVLFLVVKQYNKAVPPPPPGGPSDNELLLEIRDALRK